MSSSQQKPWSDNPNAPKIPPALYFEEKANFAGIYIGSILYGILVVLFFQCMTALFSPAHRRGMGIKWGLASYTAVMFSLVTVLTGMQLNLQSISYIDNREFPGIKGRVPPGPLGYQSLIYTGPLGIVPNAMFNLNNWLADGLLLYRCYVIFSKNFWAIAFPCLMYLGSLATGILFVYQSSGMKWNAVPINFGLPYFSISIALNVLLTLMIAIRLTLYNRNVRTAMGGAGIGGLCKAVVTMLIESSALYAVSSLLVVGQSSAGVMEIFLPILAKTQVIAPLLIIGRVANKSELTSNIIVSGQLSEFRVRSRGTSTGGSDVLPGEDPMGSVDERGVNPGEAIHQDGV